MAVQSEQFDGSMFIRWKTPPFAVSRYRCRAIRDAEEFRTGKAGSSHKTFGCAY